MCYRLCGLFLMLSLCFTTVAPAQNLNSTRWWRDPAIIERFQLTNPEIRRLRQAFTDSRRKMIRLKSRLEAEQFELQTLSESREFDEEALLAQHRKLEKARSDLAEERFKFFLQVRKIVGYDRFLELMDMQKERSRQKTR